MDANISTIYHSPLCTVHNFLCQCRQCTTSGKEHQETFSIAFIRKGSFYFKIFREELAACSGLFLLCKAGYEHQVKHIHEIPDQCTIFSFTPGSHAALMEHGSTLEWFFNNPDKQSLLIRATPATELLHQLIFHELSKPRIQQLWTEQLMSELLLLLLSSGEEQLLLPALSDRQKYHYLPMMESVKTFIHLHYADNIQLSELAGLAHMSPFHFSRLFKKITATAPYEYLKQVRLKQARLQLLHTRNTVTDIAFATGFNSLEHFSAAYKKQFGQSPLAMRK